MGAAQSTVEDLAFHPPELDMDFYENGADWARDPNTGKCPPPLVGCSFLIFLHTSQDEKLPALHRKFPNSRFTLLFSHGNGEDLGLLTDYVDDLAKACRCDVLAYEYPGYSFSRIVEQHSPSEAGCLRAIDCAYDFLVKDEGLSPDQIVLYGRSIGSGPSVDLASRQACGGVVLQSPIASGVWCVGGPLASVLMSPVDIFPNCSKARKIECPVAIIHGTDDEIVSIQNGKHLHSLLSDPFEPLWLKGYGHNDMPDDICFGYVKAFVGSLRGHIPREVEH